MKTDGIDFEGHKVGDVYRTLARTVSETDIVNFVNACGFTEPLLRPLDVVEALAAAFRDYAAGVVTVPPRTSLPVGDAGLLLVMPAAIAPGPEADGGLGTKLVT